MSCLCMCLVCEYNATEVDSFKTMSHVMEAFVTALQKLYCERYNVLMQWDTIPEELNAITHVLEQIAFNAIVNHTDIMATETLRKQHKSKDFVNFGVLTIFLAGQRSRPIENCTFACTLLQEHLAARYLSTMDLEDFMEHTEQLVTDPHLHNVAVFSCGTQSQDTESRTVPELFNCLSQRNLFSTRGLSFFDDRPDTRNTKPMSAKTDSTIFSKPVSAKTDTTIFSQSTWSSSAPPSDAGRLTDFKLSLECLNECEGLEDIMNPILDSLPSKLFVRSKDIPSWGTIGGLCHVLKATNGTIDELDYRLDHFGQYNIYASRQLAQVLEKSAQVTVLRLRWTSDAMLALFLAQIFGKNSRNTHTEDLR